MVRNSVNFRRFLLIIPLVLSTALELVLCWGTVGCGVKGRPLPPLTAPPIGRGKPRLSSPDNRIKLDELKPVHGKDSLEEDNQLGSSGESQ
ncbi:MAG: hypothetical protein C5B49_08335 [Bdellovibrio sp.]|nr:MAG: hypothetical protein C5B49_08335 [Bdellovibrio sp.]